MGGGTTGPWVDRGRLVEDMKPARLQGSEGLESS